MDKGKPYRGYLLSSLDCSLGEFYQILHDISGVPAPKLKGIPNGLIITGSKFIDCYNRHWKGQWDESFDPVRAEMSGHDWSIDCSAAKEELNFTPRDPITSLTETIEWIESQEQTTPILSRL
jgi:dihydroflavonol-4-reductase